MLKIEVLGGTSVYLYVYFSLKSLVVVFIYKIVLEKTFH